MQLKTFTSSRGVAAEYFIKDKVISIRTPVCRELYSSPNHLSPDDFLPDGLTRNLNEVVRFEFTKVNDDTFLVIRIPIMEDL